MVRYVPQPSSKTKVDIDDAYVGLGGICLLRGWSKVTQKMQSMAARRDTEYNIFFISLQL